MWQENQNPAREIDNPAKKVIKSLWEAIFMAK